MLVSVRNRSVVIHRYVSVPRLVPVPVRNRFVFIRRYVSASRLALVGSSFLLRYRLLAHCRLIMSLDPEPNDSLLEAYKALVSFLHGNDDLRAILKGMPPETSSWPSSDDIFTPFLIDMANILQCRRPRNTLSNQTIIRKFFIKVYPDKLTSGISINGKHAAHCIYSFLARLKDPHHNLNLPRLHPCIIIGFTIIFRNESALGYGINLTFTSMCNEYHTMIPEYENNLSSNDLLHNESKDQLPSACRKT